MGSTIFRTFLQIQNTAGTNAKKEILRKNMSPIWRQIFEDTYGPQKYYIKKFVPNGDYGHLFIDIDYDTFHNTLMKLANREVTGDAAERLLQNTVALFEYESQEILYKIIDRNLKIGVSLDNFLDVIGEKDTKFEVALAENLNKAKNVNPIDGTYFISRKLDGCVDYYSNIEFEDGSVKPIGEVVENGIFGNVKSFDGEAVVYKPIISHYKGDDNKTWYEITLENGNTLKITDNDRLMTKYGWKYVKDLTDSDEIMCE